LIAGEGGRGGGGGYLGGTPLLEGATMWAPKDRALVGDCGSGQALSDDQYRLLEPLIPRPKPGGRPRTTEMRRLLDALFYVVRTGCQWRHLPRPPTFPPWPTVYGYFRTFLAAGVWESMRHHLVTMLREQEGKGASPTAAILDTQSVKTTEKGALAATTPRRRSRGASAISRSTPPACCWAWWSTRPTSKTRMALGSC
jgi:putative transposase